MRQIAVVVTVLLLATSVQASRIEDATGIKYQHDGGTEGDASDICDQPGPGLAVGVETLGLLVPVDDHVDNYALPVTEELVGVEITVEIDSTPGLQEIAPPPVDHDLFLWSPGCGRLIETSTGAPGEGDAVTFVPQEQGNYTIQVQLDTDAPVPGPAPLGCHPACHRLGYRMDISAP